MTCWGVVEVSGSSSVELKRADRIHQAKLCLQNAFICKKKLCPPHLIFLLEKQLVGSTQLQRDSLRCNKWRINTRNHGEGGRGPTWGESPNRTILSLILGRESPSLECWPSCVMYTLRITHALHTHIHPTYHPSSSPP